MLCSPNSIGAMVQQLPLAGLDLYQPADPAPVNSAARHGPSACRRGHTPTPWKCVRFLGIGRPLRNAAGVAKDLKKDFSFGDKFGRIDRNQMHGARVVIGFSQPAKNHGAGGKEITQWHAHRRIGIRIPWCSPAAAAPAP
jgi:hypothetical protein